VVVVKRKMKFSLRLESLFEFGALLSYYYARLSVCSEPSVAY